jgi:hypothetical protein
MQLLIITQEPTAASTVWLPGLGQVIPEQQWEVPLAAADHVQLTEAPTCTFRILSQLIAISHLLVIPHLLLNPGVALM